jgi:serine protease Do
MSRLFSGTILTGLLATSAAAAPLADLVEQVAPSVVTVLAEGSGPVRIERNLPFGREPFEDFFRRFGEMPEMPDLMPEENRRGMGSGFVIDSEGYIVTNNHVVEGADDITIRLGDDREFTATLIGTDSQTDLALLRIDAPGLAALPLGDSDAVRVGDEVMAMGNPFGLGGTVTSGIISAKARDINSGPYVDYLQTDAAINRGNSGGPLFNLEGEVIGINTSIFSPTGGSVGIGFAVPSNTVAEVIADLRADGEVSRGWLGVSIQHVTPAIAEALGQPAATGALVAGVMPDGPSAGTLRPGDVILSLNGQTVAESRDLPGLVAATEPGSAASLRVLRDGAETDLTLTIGTLGQTDLAMADPAPAGGDASGQLGATLSAITPEIAGELDLAPEATGVVITSLKSGGAAADAGLRIGDVITRAGDSDIASPAELDAALAAAGDGATLLLVTRQGTPFFVTLTL